MISSPDYQDEDIGKAPACDEVDYQTLGIVQLVNLARWDKLAQDELVRRYKPLSRAVDFNYELRHPGHGDQSVHNPHKGAGAFVPGKWVEQPQVTKEEHLAKIKANYMKAPDGTTYTPEQQARLEGNAQQLADLTYPTEISHVRYVNGPVTLSVDKNAAAPLTPEIQARMDAVMADTQAKYPGKMFYEWTNLEGRESNATGASRLSSRAIHFDSAKMTKFKDEKGGLEHTMWHETGHAIPMKGFDTDTFTLPFEVEGLIDSYSAKVASKYPREFSIGYISEGPSGNLATMISRYATTDKIEMHAEIFALFHNPLAQMPAFQAKVVKEYGKAAGWKP
jgi:hypothetical protein